MKPVEGEEVKQSKVFEGIKVSDKNKV